MYFPSPIEYKISTGGTQLHCPAIRTKHNAFTIVQAAWVIKDSHTSQWNTTLNRRTISLTLTHDVCNGIMFWINIDDGIKLPIHEYIEVYSGNCQSINPQQHLTPQTTALKNPVSIYTFVVLSQISMQI